jgi:TRAP-type uncharacterized transport system substrate-binding protein
MLIAKVGVPAALSHFLTYASLALALVFSALTTPAVADPSSGAIMPQRVAVADRKAMRLIKDMRSSGEQNTLGLVAGAPGLTETLLAFQLANLVTEGQEAGPNGERALRIVPIAGNGGSQNVRDLLTLPGADMAIVPMNTLLELQKSGELGDTFKKLVYVSPLHLQELHIVASPNVRALSDLDGKEVNDGGDQGAREVASNLFNALGVQVKWVSIDQYAAADAILRDECAATVILSGKPVNAMFNFDRRKGFHLLPVDDPRLIEKGLLPTNFTSADYPNLIEPSERVAAVATQSVLLAYDWSAATARGRLLSDFVDTFFSKVSTTPQSARHPKWQEINLAARIPGVRRLSSAERWLHSHAAGLSAGNNGASETATGAVPTKPRQDSLYREFLQWKTAKEKKSQP